MHDDDEDVPYTAESSDEYKELVDGYGKGSPIVDLWETHLNSKEGTTYDLRKVDKEASKPKTKKISDVKLGKNYIRGIVPDKYIPVSGKEFRMFHYSVDGTYNFGIVSIKECVEVKSEDGLYMFSDTLANEKFVMIPCEKVAN